MEHARPPHALLLPHSQPGVQNPALAHRVASPVGEGRVTGPVCAACPPPSYLPPLPRTLPPPSAQGAQLCLLGNQRWAPSAPEVMGGGAGEGGGDGNPCLRTLSLPALPCLLYRCQTSG